MNGNCKQVSVDDVLCELCNELLFLPAVLNCGHGWNFYKKLQKYKQITAALNISFDIFSFCAVLCECCMSSLANGPLKCPVCESMHPGEFPNVCLDLDHFLEEQFPQQYTTRKEEALRKRAKCQNEESSSSKFYGYILSSSTPASYIFFGSGELGIVSLGICSFILVRVLL